MKSGLRRGPVESVFSGILLLAGISVGLGQAAAPGKKCPERLEAIRAAFAVRDAALFEPEMLDGACALEETYEGLYLQGFGHLFQGRSEDAVLHFSLALEIGGPWDDQLLLELMRLQKKKGDSAAEARAYERLEQSYPNSPFLARARDLHDPGWKTESRIQTLGGFASTTGHLPHEGPKAQVLGEWNWSRLHRESRFGAHAAAFMRASLDGRADHEFSVQAGPDFGWNGFSASLELGRAYSVFPDSTESFGSAPKAWNWQASGWMRRPFRPGAWLLQPQADFLVLGRSFRQAGAGLRAEIGRTVSAFMDTRVDAMDVRPDCPALGGCDAGEYASRSLEGGVGWKKFRHRVSLSAFWREDFSIPAWETAREFQSAVFRYVLVLNGSSSLLARVEGGRKSREGSWEPLLRAGANCAWEW